MKLIGTAVFHRNYATIKFEKKNSLKTIKKNLKYTSDSLNHDINGEVQHCGISSANALEIPVLHKATDIHIDYLQSLLPIIIRLALADNNDDSNDGQ